MGSLESEDCVGSAWPGPLSVASGGAVEDGPQTAFPVCYPPQRGGEEGEDAAVADFTAAWQQGNAHLEAGKTEQAIDEYTLALRLRPKQAHGVLQNRSAAFARLSRQLRVIPAAQSESRALYGLDPLSLAQLALKDADRAIELQADSPVAFACRADACFLLEQYDAAEEAYLNGLHLDPSSPLLRRGLAELRALDERAAARGKEVEPGAKRRRQAIPHSDDLDCTLCLKLLYEPCTTSCGHTFCKDCLARTMDHGLNRCPMCRTVLFLTPRSHPVSITLKNVIEKNFKAEYAERRAEMEAITQPATPEILPLFVMDVVLPGKKMALNIFEPRYRLMTRRVMEGNRMFGMLGYDARTRNVADMGCQVEITECQPMPDGRFYLEVEGRQRVKIIEDWEQDGYRVGKVAFVEDTVDEGKQAEVAAAAEETAALAREWRIREASASYGRGSRDLAEMVEQAGPMPPTSQPERLSFWVGNLLLVGPRERLAMLRTTDTAARLRMGRAFLAEPSSGASQCRMQ
ncbi:zinc finger (c3hc4-type ring finger) family protein [Klebsormidium nitens]|uniref:Zinc finger (C3hc4-type ring finger) family protein n=1 Tax=Klebsormidium nitens TaxID=105231 RepID=A0A1Y1I7C9_KLENI|nr:zinc finger (c3hc4-type ring finger) family protein [Klebsormidium nitens]|eukprot:GAQ84626.1 zinc finger (c3hc4-type ring finger) family protein [Klebsormidium nitens]